MTQIPCCLSITDKLKLLHQRAAQHLIAAILCIQKKKMVRSLLSALKKKTNQIIYNYSNGIYIKPLYPTVPLLSVSF